MLSYPLLAQQLYTAVLSDVLDSLGCMHQAMRPWPNAFVSQAP